MLRNDRVVLATALVALVLALSLLTAFADDATDPDPELKYIGVGKCRMCHPEQAKAWEKTPHARAFSWIEVSEAEKKPECLKCHVTGYGKPTGYSIDADSKHLVNVQCEACHGPGSAHMAARGKAPIERDPFATVCIDCHSTGGVHALGKKKTD